jgi:hypothetical protein
VAFSFLAIYGDHPYTEALVNAVLNAPNLVTSNDGFGEAVYEDGTSPYNAFNSVGDGGAFYSDKTNEQVLAAALYATSPPTPPPAFGSAISSAASAAAGSVWVVLPDFTAGSHSVVHTGVPKCGGLGEAFATDVYAATYFLGALKNPMQNEILDTNPTYVSQSSSSCGQPTSSIPSSVPLVVVAGPSAGEVANYYNTFSPLYYNYATGCFTRRDTGAPIPDGCNYPSTPTNDIFIMEAFTDSAGRTVFTIYGLNWDGTLAAFEYVVNFVLQTPSNYPASWYVYTWQDATSSCTNANNAIPDPQCDTYTQIASGP